MLIIRRLNCIDAASGIVLSVSGRPVHSLRENSLSTCAQYMLIFRRLNCFDAASGIVLSVSGRPVHRLREKSLSTCSPDDH